MSTSDESRVELIVNAAKAIEGTKELNKAFDKLTAAEVAAAAALVDHNKKLADAAQKKKDAAKAAEDLARKTADVSRTFERGLGGGELAERLAHLKRGFAEVGDEALSGGHRLMAFVGTAGQLARTVAAVGDQVVRAGDAIAELTRAAHGGAVTELSLAWDNLKTKFERTAFAAVRVGEAIGSAVAPVVRMTVAVARYVPFLGDVVRFWDAIVAVGSRLEGALNSVAAAIDRQTGAHHEVKQSMTHAGAEAGQLAGKLAQVDVASRAVKDSSQQMGEKLDVAQQAARGLSDTLLTLKNSARALSLEIGDGETKLGAYSRILAQASQQIVNHRNQQQLLRDVRRGLLEHGATRAEADRALGLSSSGGGARRDPSALYRRRAAEDADAARNQAALEEGVGRGYAENTIRRATELRQDSFVERMRRAQRELDAANRAMIADAERRFSESRRRAAEAANDNSFGGQIRTQFGIVRDEQTHLLRSSETFAEKFSGTISGAFNTATQAAQAHFGALIEGRETAGEALRGMVHETLLALAQESLGKALFNTAQGFALLASYQYPQAASAFTAAGIYAAVAAGAGLGAAATNAPSQASAAGFGAGGAASRERASAPPSNDNARGGGGQAIVINVNGAQFAPRQTQDAVMSALDQAARSGLLQGTHFAREMRRAG